MRGPGKFLDKESPIQGAPGADSEEKHEPVSDIDTVVVDSLKALDPEWPIREEAGMSQTSPNRRGWTHLCHSMSNLAALHSSVLAQRCGNVRLPA